MPCCTAFKATSVKSANLTLTTLPDRSRRTRQELAFLPAALEIVETPPAPTGRAIAITIMTVFALAVVWACVSPIDIISSAKGKIVPTGRVKVVQPLETGVVRAINVSDGEHVVAGQELIALDQTADKADVGHIRSDLTGAEVAVARLHAALSDADDPLTAFQAPADAPPALVAIERQHLVEQVNEQRETLASLDRQEAQKRAAADTALAAIDHLKATIPIVADLFSVYQTLYRDGNGSKVQYLQTQQTLVDQQHQLIEQQSKYNEAKEAIAAITASRKAQVQKYRSDLSDELAKTVTKGSGLEQDLVKAEERNKLQVLRAPADGVVQQLAIHTLGGVVTPAQALLVVVPTDSHLEIEAMLPNHEIGFVHPGQPVELKIDAFTFTQYGLLHGEVVSVSHDSIANQKPPGTPDKTSEGSGDQSSSEPPGQELLYAVHISLDHPRMWVEGNYVDLRSGMAVTAEIKTGSRRVISYLLSPLARYGYDSLHER
jgi:hemolysin D